MKLVASIMCAMLLLTAGNKVVFGYCEEWDKLSQLIKSQDESKIWDIKEFLEKSPDCYADALHLLSFANITFAKKCIDSIGNQLKIFISKKYCIANIGGFSYNKEQQEFIELLLSLGANINCTTSSGGVLGDNTHYSFTNVSILHLTLIDWKIYGSNEKNLSFLLKHGADVNLPASFVQLNNSDKNIKHEYDNISAYELAEKLDLKEVVQMMEPYHKSSASNAVDNLAQAFRSLSKK